MTETTLLATVSAEALILALTLFRLRAERRARLEAERRLAADDAAARALMVRVWQLGFGGELLRECQRRPMGDNSDPGDVGAPRGPITERIGSDD